MGGPGGEEGQKEAESLFKEIVTETLQNLGRDADIQVHQVHRSCRFNSKKTSSKYITIKLSKIKKDKNLKTAKEKKRCIQRNPHKNISRFLMRNLAG